MFVEILADRVGYEVDFSDVSADEMIEACYESFCGNCDKLNLLMRRITSKK